MKPVNAKQIENVEVGKWILRGYGFTIVEEKTKPKNYLNFEVFTQKKKEYNVSN